MLYTFRSFDYRTPTRKPSVPRRVESEAKELRGALIVRMDLSCTSCKQTKFLSLNFPSATTEKLFRLLLPQLSSFYFTQLIDNGKLKGNRSENENTDREKTFLQLSKQPQNYKPLVILLFMFLFQQLSGCYVLVFYTINIFRNISTDFSERVNENMALILLGTLRLIMSVVASG